MVLSLDTCALGLERELLKRGHVDLIQDMLLLNRGGRKVSAVVGTS